MSRRRKAKPKRTIRKPRPKRCCGKDTYASPVEAEIRRGRVEEFYRKPYRVYRCRKGRYHLTSQV